MKTYGAECKHWELAEWEQEHRSHPTQITGSMIYSLRKRAGLPTVTNDERQERIHLAREATIAQAKRREQWRNWYRGVTA